MRNSGSGGYRRGALAFALAVLTTTVPLAATALDDDGRQSQGFLGFWEGVDPLDGSTVQVAISAIEGDGILEFVNGEGFWTICFQLGDNYSLGRGLVTGQGSVVSEDVLEVETSLTCIDDDNNPAPPSVETSQYTLESNDRILVQQNTPPNPDILLHRTAK